MNIYIVTEYEDRFPIFVTSSFAKAKELLDSFVKLGKDDVIDLGFKNYVYNDFDDSYLGYFCYDIKHQLNGEYKKHNYKLYLLPIDKDIY